MDYLQFKELYHHGIKGQKWGIRRYTNPDGTLTKEGLERYREDLSKKSLKEKKESYRRDIKENFTYVKPEEELRALEERKKKNDKSLSDEYFKITGEKRYDYETDSEIAEWIAIDDGHMLARYSAEENGKSLEKLDKLCDEWFDIYGEMGSVSSKSIIDSSYGEEVIKSIEIDNERNKRNRDIALAVLATAGVGTLMYAIDKKFKIKR